MEKPNADTQKGKCNRHNYTKNNLFHVSPYDGFPTRAFIYKHTLWSVHYPIK